MGMELLFRVLDVWEASGGRGLSLQYLAAGLAYLAGSSPAEGDAEGLVDWIESKPVPERHVVVLWCDGRVDGPILATREDSGGEGGLVFADEAARAWKTSDAAAMRGMLVRGAEWSIRAGKCSRDYGPSFHPEDVPFDPEKELPLFRSALL